MAEDNHYAHPLDMVVNLVSAAKTGQLHSMRCVAATCCANTAQKWCCPMRQYLVLQPHLVHAQDMNRGKVVAIWHHEGKGYQVPRMNSNYHRQYIERPWRTGLRPLDVIQVQLQFSLKALLLRGASSHACSKQQAVAKLLRLAVVF